MLGTAAAKARRAASYAAEKTAPRRRDGGRFRAPRAGVVTGRCVDCCPGAAPWSPGRCQLPAASCQRATPDAVQGSGCNGDLRGNGEGADFVAEQARHVVYHFRGLAQQPVSSPRRLFKRRSTNRMVLGLGRARHRSSVRRKLSGKLFNFSPFRETADTKVEVVVKPIDDEKAIEVGRVAGEDTLPQLGADLIADLLLMSLMFTYMFYSLYLRRKKFSDLCNKQKETEQFILARLEYLEAELRKLQQEGPRVQ
ncbi:uncharacterized protein BcabD6B2_03590 [Babesia caballi]|uniref:Transmembrane protein, putative n=1 Tax=Babesia caballi TaxID=5871 RepID=A0AAV4LLX3_BABCB|nr:transmembrane protein, putative [Babesia caballi]